MARIVLGTVLSVLVGFLSATGAEAQLPGATGGVTLGARAGYEAVRGDFSDASGALGIEGSIRYRLPSGLELGLGIRRSSHGYDDQDDNAEFVGVFAEPRYAFPLPGVTPFVGARLGWLHGSFPVTGVKVSGNGYEAGGIGGISLDVAPGVAFEAAVAVSYLSVKDAKGEETTNGNFTAVELHGSTVGPAVAVLFGVSVGLSR